MDQVALQLSGHTHGGQINPGFRPAALLMEYVSGRYVRRGAARCGQTAASVSPSRVGATPEVTRVVLVSG